MASVNSFQDLVAWQLAGKLVAEVYAFTRGGEAAKDFGYRDQVQRAAVSVMSNIAEGLERGNRAEFHQFLVVAKSSLAEVYSPLYVALDTGYIDRDRFDRFEQLVNESALVRRALKERVAEQRGQQRTAHSALGPRPSALRDLEEGYDP